MIGERKRNVRGSARSELVTVRFDQRTHYALVLAARISRRSIANFVEWSVDNALGSVDLPCGERGSFTEVFATLWDVDPAKRLRKLGDFDRSLLTYDEEVEYEKSLFVEPSGLDLQASGVWNPVPAAAVPAAERERRRQVVRAMVAESRGDLSRPDQFLADRLSDSQMASDKDE